MKITGISGTSVSKDNTCCKRRIPLFMSVFKPGNNNHTGTI